MKYATFKSTDEQNINKFLKENENTVSNNGIFVFPDRVSFLVISPFDPEQDEKITKILQHKQEFTKNCQAIAEAEKLLLKWEGMGDDEEVGRKPTSGKVGGMQGSIAITAKEGREWKTEEIEELKDKNAVLAKLIKENE